MTTLAFDARMGASGDMLLGALLDLGADPSRLAPIERAIGVDYEAVEATRSGVTGADVAVTADARGAGRTPDVVHDTIDAIDLAGGVLERAHATVDLLAAAEAAVHGDDPAEVHFHEVGADDAIADICGSLALLDDLGVDDVVVGPVAAGDGSVDTAHGRYPVPTPAVTEIAASADWILRPGPVEGELLTPTGAALLATVATGRDRLPPMRVAATGYGLGDRSYPNRPNALRALLGRVVGTLRREDVTLLETVLDDTTPETLGSLQETLPRAGALDVTVVPTTMKRSRPGHLVQVVVPPGNADAVARRLAEETGTLGVRASPVEHRWVAERSVETVEVELGGETVAVDVKVARDRDGELLDASAEDGDARAVAAAHDVPVREVRRRAEAAVYDR